MQEVLREVQRAYNIGLIALDDQMKYVDKVLAEADALVEKDEVWEAAYEGYKQEHWNAP